MESRVGKKLWFVVFFAIAIIRLKGEKVSKGVVQGQTPLTETTLPQIKNANLEKLAKKTHNQVVVNNKKRNSGGGGGGGGGGVGWGWGSGGGGANQRGGWGWGNGGGGGAYWRWGCGTARRGRHFHKVRSGDYKIGEFAQCTKGRCEGMKLDCPLHCGGRCFYDCRHMCKAHCKR